jgi:hypothetical protein
MMDYRMCECGESLWTRGFPCQGILARKISGVQSRESPYMESKIKRHKIKNKDILW